MDTLHSTNVSLPADVPDYDEHDDFDVSIGRFGRLRKQFLQNHQKKFFALLSQRGELQQHCLAVHDEAKEKIDNLMQAMLRSDPPPNRNDFPLEWANFMSTTQLMAESNIIRSFVLYFPDDDENEDDPEIFHEPDDVPFDDDETFLNDMTEQEAHDFVIGWLDSMNSNEKQNPIPQEKTPKKQAPDFPMDI